MKLELCNWAIWQSIWPIERKGLLNVRSDVGWEEKNVEIRGNAIFIYPQYETQCVIGRAYLLEYAQTQLQIFNPQNLHKMPSIAGLSNDNDGRILTIKIPNIVDVIQFFIVDDESAELWKECIDKASVTNLKELIYRLELDHREEIRLLKQEIKECRLLKDESLYELCVIEKERDKLKYERDKLQSESFVSRTSSVVIQGMQVQMAKSLNERIKELKKGLERCLKEIKSKDREILYLTDKLNELKTSNTSLKDKFESTSAKLNNLVITLNDSSSPNNDTAILALAMNKNHELELVNKSLNNEISKLTSRYYSIRDTILSCFNECLETINFEEAFQLMKSWIICSELKIAYYDSLIAGAPDRSLQERLIKAQEEFVEAELRARSYYVIHRSRLLNMIIESKQDESLLEVTKISKAILTRLAWILGEDLDGEEYSRKSIEPPLRIFHSADKELHRKTMEIKKLESENASLRLEVKRLSGLVGGQVHWETIQKVIRN